MARDRICSHLSGLLIVVMLAFAPAAFANIQPILDLTGEGVAGVPLAPEVAGWEFQVDTPITIGAVGIWDEKKRPLNIAHEVGLYTSSQSLLLDVFVNNNNSTPVGSASPDGQWLFTSITPLLLQPGDYVLVATWGDPIDNADPFRLQANAVTSFVTYTGMCSKTGLDSLHLVFPDCAGAPLDNASFFGPDLAIIPEPASITLLGFGALALFRGVRRRF